MSGGPGSAGTNKKQKWGWSRYVYICFRVIFFSLGWGSLWATYVNHIYLCLWFRFMVQEPFHLCPLSRSVPLRFYVNFSYQRFSLWGLAVLCELLDGHSSLFLFLTHTLTHTASSDWCVDGVCGVLRLQRWGGVGSMLNDVSLQASPALHCTASIILERIIFCFVYFSLVEHVYCPQ